MGSAKDDSVATDSDTPLARLRGTPGGGFLAERQRGPPHRRSSDVAPVNSGLKREAAHRVMRGFSFLWTSAAFQMQQA
jgi:hypothetical protein